MFSSKQASNRDARPRIVCPASLLALAVICVLSPSAMAQQSQADADGQRPEDKKAKTLDKVLVTGSNIATTSAAMEGSVPVTVISSVELEKIAATTVFEALQSYPFFAGWADNDTRSGAGGHNGINLRGLGESYTLVLLNGRRISSNDLNQVPYAAVDRIEVVKDGASSIYGADALTGVVNVILKERYEGFQIDAGYGNTTKYNDGMKSYASILSGASSERGSLLFAAQFEKQNSILGLEDPADRSDDQTALGGYDARSDRYNPGLITLADGSQVMLSPAFAIGQTGTSASDYVSPYENLIDKRQVNNHQNGKRATSLYANARYDLVADKLVFFADAFYKNTRIDYIDHRGTYLDYDVPSTNYWNPFGQDVHVRYLLDYLNERPLESMTDDLTTTMFVAGFKGNLDAFSYELAYSSYKYDSWQTHYGFSKSGVEELLARTDSSALNLFGNQAVTAEQLADAAGVYKRQYYMYTRSLTGVIRFEPFELPAGPVSAAAGFERRWTGYSAFKDAAMNASDVGSLTFLNDSSSSNGRTVDAVYAEANLPLASESANLPGIHALDLDLAVRHEKFSDFGSVTVPSVRLRWEPFADSSLMVRASYSESFYPPDPSALVPSGDVNQGYYTDPLILDSSGNPAVYEMSTESGGNPDLQPTESKYYNLGLVYSPGWFEGFTIQVDAWKLDQVNAFVSPSVNSVLNGYAPGTIIRSDTLTPGDSYVGDAVGRVTLIRNSQANAGTRNVRGIDVNLLYALDSSWGMWNFGLYNTFTTKFVYDNADGSGEIDGLGNLRWAAIPKYRGKLQVSNQFGAWRVTMDTNYYGNLTDNYYNDTKVGAYYPTNVIVAYDFDQGGWGDTAMSGVTMSLKVNDIFDVDKPLYLDWDYRSIPSEYSYVDYVGQFVTFQMTKKF